METLAGFFKDGGMFMYFILGTAVIGISIMVERGIVLLFRYNIDARTLWNRVSKFIEDGNVEKAKILCKNSSAPLLKILYTGISVSHGSERDIQSAIDEVALEIVPAIDKRVSYLSTLANIATLLGLLGTIQGLIQAFAAVGAADPSQKALLLANGISVALYTTAFGLIAAIPMLAGYTVLQAKAHRLIDEIDEFSVKLINLLNSRRKSGLQTQ